MALEILRRLSSSPIGHTPGDLLDSFFTTVVVAVVVAFDDDAGLREVLGMELDLLAGFFDVSGGGGTGGGSLKYRSVSEIRARASASISSFNRRSSACRVHVYHFGQGATAWIFKASSHRLRSMEFPRRK